jgi:hypothetical protein
MQKFSKYAELWEANRSANAESTNKFQKGLMQVQQLRQKAIELP